MMLTIPEHEAKTRQAARDRAVAFTAELERQEEVRAAREYAARSRADAERSRREMEALKVLLLTDIGKATQEHAVYELQLAIVKKFIEHSLAILQPPAEPETINEYAHMAMHLWKMDQLAYGGRGLFPADVMNAFAHVAKAAKWDIVPRADRSLHLADTVSVEYRVYWPERQQLAYMASIDRYAVRKPRK
jgi:hypothetical protein